MDNFGGWFPGMQYLDIISDFPEVFIWIDVSLELLFINFKNFFQVMVVGKDPMHDISIHGYRIAADLFLFLSIL